MQTFRLRNIRRTLPFENRISAWQPLSSVCLESLRIYHDQSPMCSVSSQRWLFAETSMMNGYSAPAYSTGGFASYAPQQKWVSLQLAPEPHQITWTCHSGMSLVPTSGRCSVLVSKWVFSPRVSPLVFLCFVRDGVWEQEFNPVMTQVC